jgi:hypothetical protein
LTPKQKNIITNKPKSLNTVLQESNILEFTSAARIHYKLEKDNKQLNIKVKKNSKAVPLHAMKAPEGEEVQFLLILNLGSRWG